ncbi:MAG: hypothetical protein Q8O89_00210 [Nanoarchaeota archaeon]|nr:hypothetical protein [Nanoarchaeota archaeon]
MINEDRIKELVKNGNIRLDDAGWEDALVKHPDCFVSKDKVKECFLEGIYCTGEQLYKNFSEEIYQKRKNNLYVLHKLKISKFYPIEVIFPKYVTTGFYVKEGVVVFHIGPMNKDERKFYKSKNP